MLSRNCEGAVAFASHESERLGAEKVDMGHLLLGILYRGRQPGRRDSKERGVTRSGVQRIRKQLAAGFLPIPRDFASLLPSMK